MSGCDPVVNFDVDQALANRTRQTCEYVNAKYDGAKLKPESFTEWSFDVPGTDIGIGTAINELLREDPEFLLGMDVYEGAAELARSLYSDGVTVQIVTHRPPETHPETKQWLSEQDIPYSTFVHDVPKNKAKVGGDILIDDRPLNVANMAADGRWGVLVLHRHNIDQIPERDQVRTAGNVMAVPEKTLALDPERQWPGIAEVVEELRAECWC